MHADPTSDDFSHDGDFSLDDDLARIEDLVPLWRRFGPEDAEERRVAARFQFLDLVSEGAADNAPNSAIASSAIERLLAVNLVVVQAAALNCLQRDPNTFGPEGHGYLRQGARLMELCLRLANALARERKSRRRETREVGSKAAAGAEAAAPREAEVSEAAVKSAAPPRRPRAAAAERAGGPMADRRSGHPPAGMPRPARSGPPGRAPP